MCLVFQGPFTFIVTPSIIPGTALWYKNGSHASLPEMILPPFPWMLPQILPPFYHNMPRFSMEVQTSMASIFIPQCRARVDNALFLKRSLNYCWFWLLLTTSGVIPICVSELLGHTCRPPCWIVNRFSNSLK